MLPKDGSKFQSENGPKRFEKYLKRPKKPVFWNLMSYQLSIGNALELSTSRAIYLETGLVAFAAVATPTTPLCEINLAKQLKCTYASIYVKTTQKQNVETRRKKC